MMSEHTPQDTPAPPARSLRTAPRWVKWALGVSLCANLIIIGVVVGAAARHQHKGGHELGTMTMRFALHSMDEERRDQAKAVIAGNSAAMKAARRANAEARARLAEIMTADTFDAAKAEVVFADMLAAQQARRGLLHENFVVILSTMSDEERAEAARHLKKWNRWRKK